MPTPFPTSPRQQACSLCGQRHFQVVGERDRHGAPLRTVICTTCGLISHEAIPAADELAKYYQQEYRRQYQGDSSPQAHRVVRAWHLGSKLVERLRPFVHSGERVFEVGAGFGCTVKQFELAGFPASGVEPHFRFREFGVRELQADIAAGVLDDIPQQPCHDVIIVHHVLEHLAQPLQALERIRRMLRWGGRAYVEVPNVAAPHAAPGKLFHYAHIFNFTPATLRAMAAAAGFAVAHCFTPTSDETIGLLLTPAAQAAPCVDYGDNYRQAVAQITRLGSCGYYLRPTYLGQRAVRWAKQGADRVLAHRRLQAILARCQAPAKDVALLARVA